jgi:hypothetical protein
MSDTPTNHFSRQCEILADLWLNHKGDEQLADFIEYNDIGLPLAYAFAEDLAKPTELATKYITETYALLVEALEIPPDYDYESLDDMFETSDREVQDSEDGI